MATPDGEVIIVFNGEIYNFIELRNELKVLGHNFRSSGDTEVISLQELHGQAASRFVRASRPDREGAAAEPPP